MTNSPALSASYPRPRYGTPRPTGPTWGPAICRIMEWLGTPAMPWQEYAADVIGEGATSSAAAGWGARSPVAIPA